MREEREVLVKHLGRRIRMIREERNISRAEAAKLVGISARTLASYERGEREITMETAQVLAGAYKTTVTNLTNCGNILDEIRI